MVHFDIITGENEVIYNPQWYETSNYPFGIPTDRGSKTGRNNGLLSLINKVSYIDKFYLHVKDPYKHKYQFLINERI